MIKSRLSIAMDPALQCPSCQQALLPGDLNALRCANGHHFDRARQGYYNLLLSHQRKSNQSGDGPEMIAARSAFLAAEHFAPLREMLHTHIAHPMVLLDAGCGNGYFSGSAAAAQTYGIDISKPAIKSAARSYPRATWIVANLKRTIPLQEACVDAVLNVMSPRNPKEFLRVLKPGGRLIVAVPGSNHLLRLREHLLDRPQPDENKAERTISDLTEGFDLVAHTRSNFILQLDRDALDQLIAMTPLGWKSSRARKESLARFNELDVEAAFEILTFSRSTDR